MNIQEIVKRNWKILVAVAATIIILTTSVLFIRGCQYTTQVPDIVNSIVQEELNKDRQEREQFKDEQETILRKIDRLKKDMENRTKRISTIRTEIDETRKEIANEVPKSLGQLQQEFINLGYNPVISTVNY